MWVERGQSSCSSELFNPLNRNCALQEYFPWLFQQDQEIPSSEPFKFPLIPSSEPFPLIHSLCTSIYQLKNKIDPLKLNARAKAMQAVFLYWATQTHARKQNYISSCFFFLI